MAQTAHSPGGWALRLHAVCDWVFWAMTINVLWYLFTLAGGIVLGAAPATVAAISLTRRRLRGEAFRPVREFALLWRAEFGKANVVLLPALIISSLLAMRLAALVLTESAFGWEGLVTGSAAVVAILITAVLGPLYAHYNLPARSYLSTASRWLARNGAHGLLLLAALVAIIAASSALPGLIPFVSVGAWLCIDTALCVGLFLANDRLLAEREAAANHQTPVLS